MKIGFFELLTVTDMMNCRADELPRQFIAAGNSVADELPGDDELPGHAHLGHVISRAPEVRFTL